MTGIHQGAEQQHLQLERQRRDNALQYQGMSQLGGGPPGQVSPPAHGSPEGDRRALAPTVPITPTALPEASRIKTNGNGMITSGLKKTVYTALIKERDDLNAELLNTRTQVCEAAQTNAGLTKQIENLSGELSECRKDIDTKNGLLENLNGRLTQRNQEIKDLTAQTKTQQTENEKLQAALNEALKSLKDGGKHAKSEQSKSIKTLVWDHIKDRHYRTIKFVRDAELTALTKTIYGELKDKLQDDHGNPMEESEFVRIYESHVQDSLGGRRQYTQTSCQDAMVVWFKKHKAMPPADYFKAPYTIPEESDPNKKLREDFAVWYWCTFLPAAAGVDFYPKDLVFYRMPIQPLTLVPGYENSEMKGCMVTVSCEAFGLVLVQNCWDKWTHIVPKKAEDDKWPIPKYDKHNEDTHKYHLTLWSDGRNGQKKGQGWTPDGYKALNATMDALTEFRAAQKKDKWSQFKAVRKLVRKANNIPDGEKEPPPKGRKRKRSNDPPPVYAKITVEEEDCEWTPSDDD